MIKKTLLCTLALYAFSFPTVQAETVSLDYQVQYYNKVISPEGVTRESRYEEKVIRRKNEIWVSRIIPAVFTQETPVEKKNAMQKVSLKKTKRTKNLTMSSWHVT